MAPTRITRLIIDIENHVKYQIARARHELPVETRIKEIRPLSAALEALPGVIRSISVFYHMNLKCSFLGVPEKAVFCV